jgi:O-antigen/teichoic acid export membrane protein
MVVGALVSAKDMVGQAIANQLVLPGATLLGVGIAMAVGAGLEGVILAFVIAHGIALLVGTARMLKRDLPLLRNKLITAEFELGTLLRYALPQSLARALYRANLWVDILMLTWLATLADVGVYRVSVALAMLGALPVMASTTMFGPVVAELVYARDMDRLNALLKIVTRWLIVISAPLYIGVLLLPDLILALFDPAYLAGTTALGVLMAGQAIYVACAPTGACLTNAGYAMLNLINGLVAVAINVALNLLWIPEYGIMGAAGASASALSLWSLLRVIEVHVLLKCSPVSARSVVAIVGAVGMGLGLSGLLAGQGPLVRVLSVAAALLVGLGLLWRFGRTSEDDIVIGMVAAKLGR